MSKIVKLFVVAIVAILVVMGIHIVSNLINVEINTTVELVLEFLAIVGSIKAYDSWTGKTENESN